MKHSFKIGIAALAIAAAAPALAQEQETKADEAIGWTPVALGLATPVQLPWGLNRWDVYGLDFLAGAVGFALRKMLIILPSSFAPLSIAATSSHCLAKSSRISLPISV